jgi:hypothetical protein
LKINFEKDKPEKLKINLVKKNLRIKEESKKAR